jgi:hypothetical protein
MSRARRSSRTAVPTILPNIPVAETGATLLAPSESASLAMPPAMESLANMKLTIEAHLDTAARKEFSNAVIGLTHFGNRKPKLVKPRRQKIREIIAENGNIKGLYEAYATAQRVGEKRLTFQLPLLLEAEGQGNENMSDEEALIATAAPVPGSLEHARERLDGDTRTNMAIAVENMQKSSKAELRAAQALNAPPMSEQHNYKPSEPMTRQQMEVGTQFSNSGLGSSQGVQEKYGETITDDGAPLRRDEGKENKNEGTTPEDAKMIDISSLEDESRNDAAAKIPLLPYDREMNAGAADEGEPEGAEQLAATLSWSGSRTDGHIYLTPINNPNMFPMERIQVVQSQYYPTAKIVSMWTHRDRNGGIGQVSADMQDGPVNHILIKDARIVAALGLMEGVNDNISLRDDAFRIHETFRISVLPNQCTKNLKTFVVGELKCARHAFLHWLDYRGSSDPKCPPFVQEVRRIAVQSGRRAPDVWREIDGYWELEQGSGGSVFRKNRLKYLGEDPVYDEATTAKKPQVWSMWG